MSSSKVVRVEDMVEDQNDPEKSTAVAELLSASGDHGSMEGSKTMDGTLSC
jgi:hypothetical protein